MLQISGLDHVHLTDPLHVDRLERRGQSLAERLDRYPGRQVPSASAFQSICRSGWWSAHGLEPSSTGEP